MTNDPTERASKSKASAKRKRLPAISDERLAVLLAAEEMIDADLLWRAPTIRNLARGLGKAKSTIHGHLLGLRDDGLIVGNPHRARGYRISPAGQAIIDAARQRGVGSPIRRGFIPNAHRPRSEQTPNG
jgi:DNA-binding transcriptional ArsR family regulator